METSEEVASEQQQQQQQPLTKDENISYTHQVISFDVGLRHFAYCVIDVEPSLHKRVIRHMEVVDLGCKKGNPQKVIDCVIDVLDDITYNQLDLNKKTVVLIECQMTAIMKCVQTVINAYYKITSRYSSMDASTHYMSAKHKLNLMQRYKDYPRAAESLVPSSTPKNAKVTKYKQNKLDSVHFALWILEHKENDMDMHAKVTSARKKDDLTDAYLMALYHIETALFS